MTEHVFTATLWEYSADGPASWHFLTLPEDVADDVDLEAGPRGGFGSVRVEAGIGSTTWRTSLFPSSAARSFMLPVKKAVRAANDLQAGVECEVRLRVVD